jgi:hypothetical protein
MKLVTDLFKSTKDIIKKPKNTLKKDMANVGNIWSALADSSAEAQTRVMNKMANRLNINIEAKGMDIKSEVDKINGKNKVAVLLAAILKDCHKIIAPAALNDFNMVATVEKGFNAEEQDAMNKIKDNIDKLRKLEEIKDMPGMEALLTSLESSLNIINLKNKPSPDDMSKLIEFEKERVIARQQVLAQIRSTGAPVTRDLIKETLIVKSVAAFDILRNMAYLTIHTAVVLGVYGAAGVTVAGLFGLGVGGAIGVGAAIGAGGVIAAPVGLAAGIGYLAYLGFINRQDIKNKIHKNLSACYTALESSGQSVAKTISTIHES